MAQIPKGRLVKDPYKPICRDCAMYFSTTVHRKLAIFSLFTSFLSYGFFSITCARIHESVEVAIQPLLLSQHHEEEKTICDNHKIPLYNHKPMNVHISADPSPFSRGRRKEWRRRRVGLLVVALRFLSTCWGLFLLL